MEYFTGQKELARFTMSQGKRRVLVCSVYDEWMRLIVETVRCGASTSCRVTKRVGASRKDVEALEAGVKNKLGVKSLVELESTMKESLSQEKVWSETTETERSVEFTAPECGRYDIEQFQLVRTTEITMRTQRLLRKPEIATLAVADHLHQFYDNSQVVRNDENCNCDEPPNEEVDGYFNGTTNCISFTVPYSFVHEGLKVWFGRNYVTLIQSDLVGATLQIPLTWLSDLQRFLMGSNADPVVVVLEPRSKVKHLHRTRHLFSDGLGSLPMHIHEDILRKIIDRETIDD